MEHSMRNMIGAAVLAAALLTPIAVVQAFDDSKYPDLKASGIGPTSAGLGVGFDSILASLPVEDSKPR